MNYRESEGLNTVFLVLSVIGIVALFVWFIANGNAANKARVQKWEAAKQECVAENPTYYCDAMLGVDYAHSPDSF